MIPTVSRICRVVLLLVLAIGLATRTFAQGDPAAQFSPVANPNGVWSYGYENFPLPNPFNSLILPGPVPTVPGPSIDAWRVPAFGEVAVYHNGTPVNQNFVTAIDNAIFQPGELGMHPGPNDQYGVVQFTAPAAGFYKIHGTFEGLDVGGTNTSVSLLVNNIPGPSGNVVGFGIGSDVPLAAGPVFLPAGGTLAFAVGGNPFQGSTGLLNASVDAVAVPEPTSILMLGGAIALIAGRRFSKRFTV